jgi:hypothetical protein
VKKIKILKKKIEGNSNGVNFVNIFKIAKIFVIAKNDKI